MEQPNTTIHEINHVVEDAKRYDQSYIRLKVKDVEYLLNEYRRKRNLVSGLCRENKLLRTEIDARRKQDACDSYR